MTPEPDATAGFDYRPPTAPWLTVLHCDDDILVLDKPSGLLCVPGKPEAHRDCLEARAKDQFPQALLVHRLDRETSGIVVMAMNRRAQRHLGLQFERRKLTKTYIARVWGDVEGECGRIDLPLATDAPNRPRQKVDFENGRPAVTEWRVIGREDGATRLKLNPLTGRSHQLRVHLLSIGHPILGDTFYADGDALAATPRLQLHAEELSLRHPADGRPCTFVQACPF